MSIKRQSTYLCQWVGVAFTNQPVVSSSVVWWTVPACHGSIVISGCPTAKGRSPDGWRFCYNWNILNGANSRQKWGESPLPSFSWKEIYKCVLYWMGYYYNPISTYWIHPIIVHYAQSIHFNTAQTEHYSSLIDES